jgi:hypothetical protein
MASVGVRTVPFLPSLLQEKKIGIDVGFNRTGFPLLLQFKLGQSLGRFVRSDLTYPAPPLVKPFYRFSVDTAEPDGQFETLLKAETDGAEVYYVAPRFVDWTHYVRLYEEEGVLDNSVMVTPVDIRGVLVAKGWPDGPHRIVYDRTSVHLCSEPTPIREVRPNSVREAIVRRVEGEGLPLGHVLRTVYAGLEDRSSVRRRRPPPGDVDEIA